MKFKIILFLTAVLLTLSFNCLADDAACPACSLNLDTEVTYIDEPVVEAFGEISALEETDNLTFEEYMEEQCLLHNDAIDVSSFGLTYDEIKPLCFDVAMKHAELLIYTDFGFEVSGVDGTVLTVIPTYLFDTKEDADAARTEMNIKIEAYIEKAQRFDEPLKKLLAVHDELVEECDYVKNDEVSVDIYHHAYCLFVYEKGVCQAYSQAFYVLATELGFEVDYCVVNDDVHNLHHSWNYIKIDGEWYHIDVTHNDPVTDIETGTTVDHGYHNHFLCSDDKIHEGTDYTYNSSTWANYLGENIECSSDKYESHYIFNLQIPFDLRFRNDGKVCAETIYNINNVKKTVNFVYDDLYIKEPIIVSEIGKLGDNSFVAYEPIADVPNPPSFIRTVMNKKGTAIKVIEANNEELKSGYLTFVNKKISGYKIKYMMLDLYDIKPLSKAVVVE